MALTVTLTPNTKYIAAGNPVYYEVQTDRLKEVETSWEIGSINNSSGFLELITTATHDITEDDVVTISGFSVASLNAKHTVTSVTTTHIVLSTAYQSAWVASSHVIRTNDNFFVEFELDIYTKLICQITGYDVNGYALFKKDISEYLKTIVDNEYYYGSDWLHDNTNSAKGFELRCTEYYFDKNDLMKSQDILDDVDEVGGVPPVVYPITLNTGEAIEGYFYTTAPVKGKFLTDNQYMRYDFTQNTYVPQLQFINSEKLDSGDYEFKVILYNSAGSVLDDYSIDNVDILADSAWIVNLQKLITDSSFTAQNLKDAYYMKLKLIDGSDVFLEHTIYNENRKSIKPAYINYLNRFNAFDFYQFAEETENTLKNNSVKSLNDITYKKAFSNVDDRAKLLTYKEGNSVLNNMAQMIYSSVVYYGANATAIQVFIENDDAITYSSDLIEFEVDIIKKRVKTW